MAQKTTTTTQKRAMGGGGPAPEWEGIDKVVRGVFPGDHHRTFIIIKLAVFITTAR
jgi:hypothetical protein